MLRAPSRLRHAVSLALALALLSGSGAVQASPDTLRLAFEDIAVGGLDLASAPVTAVFATVRTTREMADNWFLRVVYIVPGWVGLTFLQASQAALRIGGGALELIPGVVLFPFPGVDLPEGLNVFRRGDHLLELENPLAENPSWLPWVLPITPFTIDVRYAPVSPWAPYAPPQGEEMARTPAP